MPSESLVAGGAQRMKRRVPVELRLLEPGPARDTLVDGGRAEVCKNGFSSWRGRSAAGDGSIGHPQH